MLSFCFVLRRLLLSPFLSLSVSVCVLRGVRLWQKRQQRDAARYPFNGCGSTHDPFRVHPESDMQNLTPTQLRSKSLFEGSNRFRIGFQSICLILYSRFWIFADTCPLAGTSSVFLLFICSGSGRKRIRPSIVASTSFFHYGHFPKSQFPPHSCHSRRWICQRVRGDHPQERPNLSRVKSFCPPANFYYFMTLPFRFIMIKNYDWPDMNYDQARLQSERTAE